MKMSRSHSVAETSRGVSSAGTCTNGSMSPLSTQGTGIRKNSAPRESWQTVADAKQEIKWLSKAIRAVGEAPEGHALMALSHLLDKWQARQALEMMGESPCPQSGQLLSEVQELQQRLSDQSNLVGLWDVTDIREVLIKQLATIKRERIRRACKAAVASAGSTLQYLGRMSRDAADKFAHASKASPAQPASMNRRLWDVSFEQENHNPNISAGNSGKQRARGARAGLGVLHLSPLQINNSSSPGKETSIIDKMDSLPRILRTLSPTACGSPARLHGSEKAGHQLQKGKGQSVGCAETLEYEALVTVFNNRHLANSENLDTDEGRVKMRGLKGEGIGINNPVAEAPTEELDCLLAELRRGCLAQAAAKAKEAATHGETEKALSQALADLALSRSLVSWLAVKHLKGEQPLDAAEAAEWLAGAVDIPLHELCEQLGLDLDACGSSGRADGQRPLALALSKLIHGVVSILRKNERREKRSRASLPKIPGMVLWGPASHSLAVSRSLPVLHSLPR